MLIIPAEQTLDWRRPPWATLVLITISCFTYLIGVSVREYGFVPARFDFVNFLVSIFLHQNIDHLIGNMVFLFVCGFSLEIALGRLWLLGLYLSCGYLASLLSYASNIDSSIIEIGASGAVSGLMGMYAALYGFKKINFFYWVLVFIGYFRAPALVIFPIWVAKELYGMLLGPENINYLAHLGGLVSGFVLVVLTKNRVLEVDTAYVEKEISDQDVFAADLQKMWDLMGHLRFEDAWKLGIELLKENPQEPLILKRLFIIAKTKPADKMFHKIALQIFTQDSQNLKNSDFVADTIQCYAALAPKPVALNVSTCLKLVNQMCHGRHSDAAYILASRLIKNPKRHDQIAKAIFAVFMLLLEVRNNQAAETLLGHLKEEYPNSAQTEMATDDFQRRMQLDR
ncbi:MAG: rhomboid family intramembrane serine protease [Pseudomonadales bacterium]|nr:rhomboid family intramembrane serine protease [Pseudomonadales bacterium]